VPAVVRLPLGHLGARGYLAGCLAGCLTFAGCSSGSVELVLDPPEAESLAPLDPASVTLVASTPGGTPRATTSLIAADGSFDLGELPVGGGLDLAVELRDASQRLVGYGRAVGAVTVSPDDAVEVRVPVRRPFLYVTAEGAGTRLATFDPTRDPLDGSYKGSITTPASTTIAVPAGGSDVALVGSDGLRRLSTSNHEVESGAPTDLPGGIRDAVTSPDGAWLVIGHDEGIALVDVTTGAVTDQGVDGAVDRVALAARPDGGLAAIGLIGRATECGETSSIVTVPLDGSSGPIVVELDRPLADIGASPQQARVVGADACKGELAVVSGGEGTLTTVRGPTAVAVLGSRAFVVGVVPGVRDDEMITMQAAYLEVVAVDVVGGAEVRVQLPPVIQNVVATQVPSRDITRGLKAHTATPIDLSVVPPGDLVALVYSAEFDAPVVFDAGFTPIFPLMNASSAEYQLVDLTSGTFVQRVRTTCQLETLTPGAFFRTWECDPSAGQDVADSDFVPASVAALYGAR
jgi:hypothetical protein